jgi:hypothetical protein
MQSKIRERPMFPQATRRVRRWPAGRPRRGGPADLPSENPQICVGKPVKTGLSGVLELP